jgi:acetylornithine deacetylase
MAPPPLSDADLLARLVAFDTTSDRSNLELADFLAGYLERPGVRVRRHPSPDGAKANLVVFAGPALGNGEDGDGDRPGLVLSGHMDVVPAGEGWSSDPFTLTDAGDSWVARGSADMKGFVALAANLARAVEPGRLAAPLVLVLTYDEEVGMLGARHLVESWDGVPWREPLPRAAVIGEPTELAVVAAHKGHVKLRALLRGRSAHSGYPHLGINAIEAGGRAIAALTELRRALETERPPGAERFAETPYPALNVGTVHGGTAVNVVPERCAIEVGVRVLPGMDSAALAGRVRAAIAGAAAGDDPGPVECAFEPLAESPPLAVRDGAPILRALSELTGRGGLDAVSYATDGGWLARLGLDCAVWGPGSITVAHKPDEFLPKADLAAARPVLEALIERFCGHGGAA